MQVPTSSLVPPEFKGFTYPAVTSRSFRGFETTDSQGQATWIGEPVDIKNVKHYSLKEGKLTFKLNEGLVFVRDQEGKLLREKCRDLLYTTDAVLNQLGITIFEKMTRDDGIETIGLLNGQKGTQPPLFYSSNPWSSWYRNHFDDQSTKEINFSSIKAFAFDRTTFKQTEDGSEFSLELEKKYENDPAVIYAVHKIFGETYKLTERLD